MSTHRFLQISNRVRECCGVQSPVGTVEGAAASILRALLLSLAAPVVVLDYKRLHQHGTPRRVYIE